MKSKFAFLVLFLAIFLNSRAQTDGDWEVLIPPDSPELRHGHSMVTLPDGRVMMFGGQGIGQSWFNDLHAYKDANWSQVTPENPPPPARSDHSAWTEGDRMFIFSGHGENGPLNDMWSYDIVTNTWTEHPLSGTIPTARYGHSITTTSDGTRLVLGGKDADGNTLKDFYRINPDYSCTPLPDAPDYYFDHIAHLVDDDLLMVFGKTGIIGLYQLSVGIWGETPGGFPVSQFNSHIVSRDIIFAFGGKDDNGNVTKTVYVYNTTTGEFHEREDPLPATMENNGAAKYFNNRGDDDYTVVLFGGIIDGEISNTTYVSTGNLLAVDHFDRGSLYELQTAPNPSNGLLNISSRENIQHIQVYDLSGRLLKELTANQRQVMLDIKSLENGLYIVKLTIDNKQISRKVLKQ